MRWSTPLSLGIGSYLLFLVLNFPAQQAVGLADKAGVLAPIGLDGVQGTFWSGEAAGISFQQMPLGHVTWRISPASLLLGRLRYNIDLRDASQQLTGSVQTGLIGGYRLEALKGQVTADRIPQLIQQRQIRIGGRIELDQVDLSFEEGRLTSADGRIRWFDALIASPMKLKTGDLQADLSTETDGGVKVDIRDLSGPTAIKASAILAADGNYRFEASLKPGSETDPALTTALKAVSHGNPDGSFQLKFTGRI